MNIHSNTSRYDSIWAFREKICFIQGCNINLQKERKHKEFFPTLIFYIFPIPLFKILILNLPIFSILFLFSVNILFLYTRCPKKLEKHKTKSAFYLYYNSNNFKIQVSSFSLWSCLKKNFVTDHWFSRVAKKFKNCQFYKINDIYTIL